MVVKHMYVGVPVMGKISGTMAWVKALDLMPLLSAFVQTFSVFCIIITFINLQHTQTWFQCCGYTQTHLILCLMCEKTILVLVAMYIVYFV